jgi:hypothetical protein
MASYAYTFTSGDTITPTKLNNARTVSDIVNADIKSDAAIAGTKVTPDFGSQNIVTSGSSGVGTSTLTQKFEVSGGNVRISSASQPELIINSTASGSYKGKVVFKNSDASKWEIGVDAAGNGTNNLYFYDNSSSSERARFDNSGNFIVGTSPALNVFSGSSDGVTLERVGLISASRDGERAGYFRRRNSNGEVVGFLRDTSQVGWISVTTTGATYNTLSDYRLKTNVEPMVGGLAKLNSLAPKTFEFISQPNVKVDGFIAHEVQDVVPIAVTGEKDGAEMQGMDNSKLVPLLVAAVQELSAKVDTLEAAQ